MLLPIVKWIAVLVTQWVMSHAYVPPPDRFSRIDPANEQSVDTIVNQYFKKYPVAGLSIGLLVNGEVSLMKGYGYADVDAGLPATANTRYRLASISKTMTAILALQLVAEGKLDLDADIRTYVPEYPVKPQGIITTWHLLSNTSGIMHYNGADDGQYCKAPYDEKALKNYIGTHSDYYDPIVALDIFKNQPICFTPGEHYQYTTWGFCLLGAVVERAGHQPFAEQAEQRIICPLHLPTLRPEYQARIYREDETTGYTLVNGKRTQPKPGVDLGDVSYKLAGGGYIGTVVDLLGLARGITEGNVLPTAMVARMGENEETFDGKDSPYGLGVFVEEWNGCTVYYHTGSQSKTATILYFDPINGNAVAIMCNTRNAPLKELARALFDQLPDVSLTGDPYAWPATCRPLASNGSGNGSGRMP